MGQPLSLDLRVRLLAAIDAGMSCRGAAARFGVAPSTAIRWQEQRRTTGSIAPKPQGGDMRSRRVEARREDILGLWEARKDISLEELRASLAEIPVAVDRAIQHHRRDHPGHAQPGHQRGGFAVPVREAHAQALAPGAATVAAGHVGCGPGFVDEDEPLRFQIELMVPQNPTCKRGGPYVFARHAVTSEEAVKPGHRDGQAAGAGSPPRPAG
jgi:transposase